MMAQHDAAQHSSQTSQILLSDICVTVPQISFCVVCLLSFCVDCVYKRVVGLEAGPGGLGRRRWRVSFAFRLCPVFQNDSKVDIPY